MNLYEMNAQIEELSERLVNTETGEIDEAVMKELDELNMARDEKLEGCGIVIKNLAAECIGLKYEIDALKERMASKERRMDNMMRYVDNNLRGEKFETSKVAFSYRKSQSVDVVNEEAVPDALCKYETTRKPVKTEIKKLLKSGEDVPGCVLVEKNNLNIK